MYVACFLPSPSHLSSFISQYLGGGNLNGSPLLSHIYVLFVVTQVHTAFFALIWGIAKLCRRELFTPRISAKLAWHLMYLSVWWLENEVAEEVLHIRHTLLDFNSTEVIRHCPLDWVFAVLSAEAPALECAHSTKKVFPSLKWEEVQVCSPFCLWQTNLWTILSTDFIFLSFFPPKNCCSPIDSILSSLWFFLKISSNSQDMQGSPASANTVHEKARSWQSWRGLNFSYNTLHCSCQDKD